MGLVHQLDPYKVQEITTLGKVDDSKVRVVSALLLHTQGAWAAQGLPTFT
jgi:hypothetical protein